jgi:hypothetical protein
MPKNDATNRDKLQGDWPPSFHQTGRQHGNTQRGKHHGLGHFGMIVLFMLFLFAFIRLIV